MIATIERGLLLRELALLVLVVEKKSELPSLRGVLIETVDGGLVLSTSNLEQSLRVQIPADIHESGSVCIPAHSLSKWATLLPEGSMVEISSDNQRERSVSFRANGVSMVTVEGFSLESFPKIPALPNTGHSSFPPSVLRRAVSYVYPAISKDESRYTLGGALLDITAEMFSMVATDGHRLAVSDTKINATAPFRAIVSRDSLRIIRTLLENTQENGISASQTDKDLFFQFGHRTLTEKPLSGKFPQYQAVIPGECSWSFTASASLLLSAIERATVFADPRTGCIHLSLSDETLAVRAANAEDVATESVACIPSGATTERMAFNAYYLIELLRTIPAATVVAKFNAEDNPGLWSVADQAEGQSDRLVVMPMRA